MFEVLKKFVSGIAAWKQRNKSVSYESLRDRQVDSDERSKKLHCNCYENWETLFKNMSLKHGIFKYGLQARSLDLGKQI